jgi:hypothetical protein
MNLEVGKKYVLSDGAVARCICVDRARQGGLGAILLYTGEDRSEYTVCCAPNGSSYYGTSGRSVVKEYKEPIKVRVFVWRGSAGSLLSMAVANPSYLNNPISHWGFHVGKPLVSDTIIEVEDQS